MSVYELIMWYIHVRNNKSIAHYLQSMSWCSADKPSISIRRIGTVPNGWMHWLPVCFSSVYSIHVFSGNSAHFWEHAVRIFSDIIKIPSLVKLWMASLDRLVTPRSIQLYSESGWWISPVAFNVQSAAIVYFPVPVLS